MKKLTAVLSALALFASSGAFAQETTAEVTPAETVEEETCESLTGLKLELCNLRKERARIKASAKSLHKKRVEKTTKKSEKRAAQAAIKVRHSEMKGELKRMKKTMKGELRNLRGVKEIPGKVRREKRASEGEAMEESGQAVLQSYGSAPREVLNRNTNRENLGTHVSFTRGARRTGVKRATARGVIRNRATHDDVRREVLERKVRNALGSQSPIVEETEE